MTHSPQVLVTQDSRAVTGTTRTYAVIGDPANHSLSPAMHNASFATLGIDAIYVAHTLPPERVSAAFYGMSAMGYRGCNVTMPHKRAIFELCDEVSNASQLMESVNTVIFRDDGSTYGTNTDGTGTFAAVEDTGHAVGETVTVLGAGGASSAIYTQAALGGIKDIQVFARQGVNYNQALQRIETVNKALGVNIALHDLGDTQALERRVRESSFVANATSVGMEPDADQCLVEEEWLHSGQVIFDAVYYPLETLLLQRARNAGAQTVGGLDMLLWQGVHSEEYWLERKDIPVDAMRKAMYAQAYGKQ